MRFNTESNHRGAPRPGGGQLEAAPMLSLLNLIILCPDICILCLFGQIQQIFYEIPINPLKAISRNLAPSGAGFLPSTVARLASEIVKYGPIWIAVPQFGLILCQIEADGLNNTSICLRTLFSTIFNLSKGPNSRKSGGKKRKI